MKKLHFLIFISFLGWRCYWRLEISVIVIHSNWNNREVWFFFVVNYFVPDLLVMVEDLDSCPLDVRLPEEPVVRNTAVDGVAHGLLVRIPFALDATVSVGSTVIIVGTAFVNGIITGWDHEKKLEVQTCSQNNQTNFSIKYLRKFAFTILIRTFESFNNVSYTLHKLFILIHYWFAYLPSFPWAAEASGGVRKPWRCVRETPSWRT